MRSVAAASFQSVLHFFFNKAHCREDYVLKRRGNLISVFYLCQLIAYLFIVLHLFVFELYDQLSYKSRVHIFGCILCHKKTEGKFFLFVRVFFSILEWRTDKENNILIRFRVFSRDFLSIEQPTISKVVGCKNSNVKLVGLSCS